MCSTRSSSARTAARLLVACLVLTVARLAPAGHAATGKAHLERGLKLYRAGHYREAIVEFETGYTTVPNPAFLLNIAQAWRHLGQLERTRAYYQKFVEHTSPQHPAHAQALAAIEKLDAQLGERTAAQSARPPKPEPVEPAPAVPPPTTAPTTTPAPTGAAPAPAEVPPAALAPSPPPPPRARAVGWAGVGLVAGGAAALGAGAGLTVLAQQAHDQYLHPAEGTVYDPKLLERRDLDRDLAIASFAVGGALVVAGSVLVAVFLPRRAARASAWRLQWPALEARF